MTNFKHPSLICTTVVVATIISLILPLGHCRVILRPNDANLIQDTCNRTPNPSLCLQILRSDPRSSSADVKGLALIMVDVIKAKANDALSKIQRLLQGGGDKNALNSCSAKYKAILVGDVPQATQGLRFGNPKFAEDAASDSAVEANSCEHSFIAGKSPLTIENNGMRGVADVTRAIVRLLL